MQEGIPIGFPTTLEIFLCEFEKGLANKPSANIIDCRSQGSALELFLQLCECILHTLAISTVSTDTDRSTAFRFDFFHERFVIRRVSGKEGNGIVLCKATCNARSSVRWVRPAVDADRAELTCQARHLQQLPKPFATTYQKDSVFELRCLTCSELVVKRSLAYNMVGKQ